MRITSVFGKHDNEETKSIKQTNEKAHKSVTAIAEIGWLFSPLNGTVPCCNCSVTICARNGAFLTVLSSLLCRFLL